MSDLRFKIGAEELPVPANRATSLGDGILINLVTGLSTEDFQECPLEAKIGGLMALALRKAHPDWPVARIADLVLNLEPADWSLLGLEVAGNGDPPAEKTSGSGERTGSSGSASESEEPQG